MTNFLGKASIMRKKLMVLGVLLISLLCVSAVSAAEDGVSSTFSSDNEYEIISGDSIDKDVSNSLNEDEKLIFEDYNQIETISSKSPETNGVDEPLTAIIETGSFKQLNDDISYAGAEFNFGKNYTYNETMDGDFQTGILIERDNFVIDGQGFTINGMNQSRLFLVNARNLTIKNLNFIYGYVRSGEGIAIDWQGEYGTLFNCSFRGNGRDQVGGVVFWHGNNGLVDNCTFENNHNNGIGGSIYWNAVEGVVRNSIFINNSAGYGSGIFWVGKKGLVYNCSFINGTGGSQGAVSWQSDNGTLRNCTFINNSISASLWTQLGGAAICWFSRKGTISDCIFINNSAPEGSSGALQIECANATVENCTFENNSAIRGGAIYSTNINNTIINNCTFKGNEAAIGGAIYYYTTHYCVISNSTFIANKVTDASNGGGAIVWYSYYGNITHCSFINNSAPKAGALYMHADGSSLTDSLFANNTANGNGGALICEWFTFKIGNCTFENNTAKNKGGAFYINPNSKYTLSNSSFINNSAKNGGAVYVETGGIQLNDSIFLNNSATNYGGAVHSIVNTNVENSEFRNNSAVNGSALYLKTSGPVIKNSILLNNKAEIDSIDLTDENFVLTAGFIGNDNYINAVYATNNVSFSNVTYWDGEVANTDDEAPVKDQTPGENIIFEIRDIDYNLIANLSIELDEDNQVKFDYINFDCGIYYVSVYHEENDYYTYKKGEETTIKIGAFELLQYLIDNATENSTLNLTRNYTYTIGVDIITEGIKINKPLTINGNGFTIDALGQSTTFDICSKNVVLNNISFKNGAYHKSIINVRTDAPYCEINNCNFTGNNLMNNYEIIFILSDFAKINNCRFIDNDAIAIFIAYESNNISIFNCTFINNSLGIQSKESENNAIIKCTFINNSGDYGGGIGLNDNNTIISYCDFIGNQAYSGAAIYIYGNDIRIVNCNFTNNSAERYGGAIGGIARNIKVINSNFINNSAQAQGGAIDIRDDNLFIEGSVFMGNYASEGGAIYQIGTDFNMANSVLLDNKANSTKIQLIADSPELVIKFKGENNYINAIRTYSNIIMENVTYWNGEVLNSDDVSPIEDSCSGLNITLKIYNSQGDLIKDITGLTDIGSKVSCNIDEFPDGHYSVYAYHYDDSHYTEIGGLIGEFDLTRNSSSVTIDIDDMEEFYYDSCRIGFTIENRTEVKVVITDRSGMELVACMSENDYFVVDLPANDDYYNITVYNLQTREYSGSEDSKSFKLLKVNSTIEIAPIQDIIYNNEMAIEFNGENLTVVNVSLINAEGEIAFSQNTTGNAVTIPVLDAGKYTVIATNYGNENISESTCSASFNINKDSTILYISNITAFFNEPVNFAISLKDSQDRALSNAELIVCINCIEEKFTNEEGNVIISTEGLDVTKYTAFVFFNGNKNYDSSNAIASITILKSNNATITLSPVKDSFAYGEDVIIDVTVKDEDEGIIGTVVLTVNGTDYSIPVTDGVGQAIVKGLSNGTHEVTAKFTGNANYTEANADSVYVIVNASTKTLIAAVGSEVTYGEDSTVTVTAVDGANNPIEVAAIKIGEDVYTISDGKFNLGKLDAGTYTLAVVFDDGIHEEASTDVRVKVNPASATITASAADYAFDQNGTLKISVKDSEGNGLEGTVNLTIDMVLYKSEAIDGEVEINLSGFAPGLHFVDLVFINSNYAAERGVASFNVTKKASAVSIRPVEDSFAYGEDILINVTLKDGDDGLSGIVVLSINGTDYAVNVSNGFGQATVNGLDEGNYTIDAKFIGNEFYDECFADTTFEVREYSNVILNIVGSAESIVINLADSKGRPINGTVNVTIDGVTKEVPVVNGTATVPVASGNHNVTVSYPADAVHSGSTVNKLVNVKASAVKKVSTKITFNKKQTITYNKKLDNKKHYYITATLKDANGKALAGKKVKVYYHGKSFTTKTNAKGQFKFRVAHKIYGECTQVLSFAGDEKYADCFTPAYIKVKKQKVKLTAKKKTFKANKKVKRFTAILKNSKGKAIKGKKIVFRINKKKYTAKTNKKGKASIKIKLSKKKTYKVKVRFAGDNTYFKKTRNTKVKIK